MSLEIAEETLSLSTIIKKSLTNYSLINYYSSINRFIKFKNMNHISESVESEEKHNHNNEISQDISNDTSNISDDTSLRKRQNKNGLSSSSKASKLHSRPSFKKDKIDEHYDR